MPPRAQRNSLPHSLALLISFWISAIAVILFLAGWVTQRTIVQRQAFFSNAPLGGQFTQLQAKAIDFAGGAVVAPLCMAVATFWWFRVSRTIAFGERDEGQQQSVSLQALVELATTETGSFNAFKFRTLAKTRQPRFLLFGVLTVFAAISSTLFANVIAYEAYQSPSTPSTVVMKLLNWNWLLQRDDFVPNVQLLNVVNMLSFQNASSLLDEDGAYTRANLTEASIASLLSTVVELNDVPAYRQTITCEPAQMDEFNLIQTKESNDYLKLTIKSGSERKSFPFSTVGDIDLKLQHLHTKAKLMRFFIVFQTYVSGKMKALANDWPSEVYNFVANDFQNDGWVAWAAQVMLVTATRQANTNMTPHNGSSPSSFGNLPHFSFEVDFGPRTRDCVTDPGDHGCPDDNHLDPQPPTKMEAWGVVCKMNFQFGTASMARPSTSVWSLTRSSFPDPPVFYLSWLPILEAALGQFYHWPVASLGGVGAALSQSATYESTKCTNCCAGCDNPQPRPVLNFTAFAENYLYADATLLTSILNYDQCPTCRHDGSSDILVRAGIKDCTIVYRVTYISGLLVLALVAFAATATIPLAMMMWSLDAVALRQWRVVDALRVVADVARSIGPTMERDIGDWSKTKLSKWADTVMLGYHVVQGQTGDRVELNVAEPERRNADISRRWRDDEHDDGGDGASQHLLDVLDESDAAP